MTASIPSTVPTDLELTPSWEHWVVNNLVAGVPPATLLETMQTQGIPGPVAQAELTRVMGSAAFQKLITSEKQNAQLHQILALRRQLVQKSRADLHIPRQQPMSERTFFEHYYRHNQPVILEGLAKAWPALDRWRPDYLIQILGDEMVEVTTDRESDPDYDMNFKKHSTDMCMADFLNKVQALEHSNDIYMTANNRMMERPAFQKLIEDVQPPLAYVQNKNFAGGTSLWMGPSGTKTPLHHDNTNILFCQVVGRKEFHMVSPLETTLLQWATRTYYNKANLNPVDLEQFPELADVPIHSCVLKPGDALFIPVGWWHQVQSLDFSISLSFTNLLRPNRFDWFHPENCD